MTLLIEFHAADGVVGAGRGLARWSVRARVAYSTSSTSELFPLPLTPVTTVNVPSGIWTLMFLRLFCRRRQSPASRQGRRGKGRMKDER